MSDEAGSGSRTAVAGGFVVAWGCLLLVLYSGRLLSGDPDSRVWTTGHIAFGAVAIVVGLGLTRAAAWGWWGSATVLVLAWVPTAYAAGTVIYVLLSPGIIMVGAGAFLWVQAALLGIATGLLLSPRVRASCRRESV